MKLKTIIIFPLHFCLQMTNLGLWALMVFCLGIIKFCLPISLIRIHLLTIMHYCYISFSRISVLLIRLFNSVTIENRIHGELSKQKWYLLIANHLSYLDIILLIHFSADRIPAPKFFLKKELIWLPFVGIAAWAMDMPFMQRYSKAFLAKHPHLKGKDIETTRQCCEKYKHRPTTIINFVEGTRFTVKKHASKNSSYTRLLPPKAGGMAFALSAMGELFEHIVDVTLLYPENTTHPMMDMLSGDMKRIVIDVNVMAVPQQLEGDYFNDDIFRSQFQTWLNKLWQHKDVRLQQLTN